MSRDVSKADWSSQMWDMMVKREDRSGQDNGLIIQGGHL